tara:strand:+ start:99 stop:392 length:294 start_codon:yes stop_codon:yes gene_type:complete
MKKIMVLLLSTIVQADDHNQFTIDCVNKIEKKYQIALDLDTKKFRVSKSDTIISEGSIAKINRSKNSIEFKLLEINTKDKKKIFTGNNLHGKLICNI